jgi:hypothetical protein
VNKITLRKYIENNKEVNKKEKEGTGNFQGRLW